MHKNRAWQRILIVFVLVLLGSLAFLACLREDAPSLDVRGAKAEYMEGEPIGIEISIANPGPGDIRVMFDYPQFAWSSGGFHFDTRKAKASVVGLGGIVPTIRIPEGETFTTTAYLQRYIEQLRQGKYQIPFVFMLSLYDDSHGRNDESPLMSRGELSFVIQPANSSRLEQILRKYATALDDPDYWKKRAAAEALSVVDDPAVVPYLKCLLDNPLFTNLGFKALERFQTNQAARAAILGMTDSEQHLNIVRALDVLKRWKHQLAVDKVRSLLKHHNTYVVSNTLKYLITLNVAEYRILSPEVSALIGSNDPDVIASAHDLLEQWNLLTKDQDLQARRNLLALLQSPDSSIVIRALNPLGNWNERISREELQSLRSRDMGIQFAVGAYLKMISGTTSSENRGKRW